MNFQLNTQRLLIEKLSDRDAEFIFELLNTEAWKEFIGDRSIDNINDAKSYISKINQAPHISYSIVKLKESQSPIGLVTFIKRDYLEHHDIGFAFLPQFSKKGYAFEAAKALLMEVLATNSHKFILATTLQTNSQSIRLLEKLGFTFTKEIQVDTENLQLYSASADKLSLNFLTANFYAVFTNTNERIPNLESLNSLCLSTCDIVKKQGFSEEYFSLQKFIEPRKIILTNGLLRDFEEMEISETTTITDLKAFRISKYKKSGIDKGSAFHSSGTKKFSFVKSSYGWKIASFEWEDDN